MVAVRSFTPGDAPAQTSAPTDRRMSDATSAQSRIGAFASAFDPDPRAVPAVARGLGIDGLLFDAYGAGFSIPDLSGSGRREFRQVLSAQDVQLVGLRGELGPKGLGPGADVDRL